MTVGFDYYKTITAHPSITKKMASDFKKGGDHVVIISATGEGKTHEDTLKKKANYEDKVKEQLEKIKFPFDELLVICVKDPKHTPHMKTNLAIISGVKIFFDDREDTCREMIDHGIVAFKVVEPTPQPGMQNPTVAESVKATD